MASLQALSMRWARETRSRSRSARRRLVTSLICAMPACLPLKTMSRADSSTSMISPSFLRWRATTRLSPCRRAAFAADCSSMVTSSAGWISRNVMPRNAASLWP
jgi:hypothetical protein